jgi:sugar-specific transcriptional regulator TrmB
MIESMISLGFSENEAKTYISLVKTGMRTAYEISKDCGVPSSKIYGVLSRLVEKEIVAKVTDEGKNCYVAMPYGDVIQDLRTRMDSTLDTLERDLRALEGAEQVSWIWNCTDYEYLMMRARQAASEAGQSILLSGWKEEIDQLADCIKEQSARGTACSIIHFGPGTLKHGQVFHHPIENTIYDEKGGRALVLVIDSREVLFGTILEDGSVAGAWSRNRGFVTMAEDYIKHDIYIMKIVERFDPLLLKTFGRGYHALRDIFTDEEAHDEDLY